MNRLLYSSIKQLILMLLLLSLAGCAPLMGNAKAPASQNVYNKVGNASWYGAKHHGRRTVTGKRFNMYEMTAASLSLPLGSYASVTNLSNNKTVVVKITDRGPFSKTRIIDVSYAAAKKLEFVNKGVTRVQVQAIKVPPPSD